MLQQLQQRRHDELLRLAAHEDVRDAHEQRGERLADLLAAGAGQSQQQLLQQRAGIGQRAPPALPPERHRASERVQRLLVPARLGLVRRLGARARALPLPGAEQLLVRHRQGGRHGLRQEQRDAEALARAAQAELEQGGHARRPARLEKRPRRAQEGRVQRQRRRLHAAVLALRLQLVRGRRAHHGRDHARGRSGQRGQRCVELAERLEERRVLEAGQAALGEVLQDGGDHARHRLEHPKQLRLLRHELGRRARRRLDVAQIFEDGGPLLEERAEPPQAVALEERGRHLLARHRAAQDTEGRREHDAVLAEGRGAAASALGAEAHQVRRPPLQQRLDAGGQGLGAVLEQQQGRLHDALEVAQHRC